MYGLVRQLTGLSICAKMVSVGLSLRCKFSSLSEPPISARANGHVDKQGNSTHILFASQQLQCSIKFITSPIN